MMYGSSNVTSSGPAIIVSEWQCGRAVDWKWLLFWENSVDVFAPSLQDSPNAYVHIHEAQTKLAVSQLLLETSLYVF